METIRESVVRSRKRHTCNLCGGIIPARAEYNMQINVYDGRLYTWRTHLHCQSLCGKIWNYVDPDEGMTYDRFQEAVAQLMHTFYCPYHCDEYFKQDDDCDRGFDAECVRLFAQFMEPRALFLVKEPNGFMCWRVAMTGGAS